MVIDKFISWIFVEILGMMAHVLNPSPLESEANLVYIESSRLAGFTERPFVKHKEHNIRKQKQHLWKLCQSSGCASSLCVLLPVTPLPLIENLFFLRKGKILSSISVSEVIGMWINNSNGMDKVDIFINTEVF